MDGGSALINLNRYCCAVSQSGTFAGGWPVPSNFAFLSRPILLNVLTRPAAISPRCQSVAFFADIGDGIVSRRAPGAAARQPRDGESEAAPGAVLVDGAQRVFRTGGQMPTLPTDIGLQRPPVYMDREFQQRCRQVHAGCSVASAWLWVAAPSPSICFIAPSTASKTRRVEG